MKRKLPNPLAAHPAISTDNVDIAKLAQHTISMVHCVTVARKTVNSAVEWPILQPCGEYCDLVIFSVSSDP
ncbi:hypothetical protein TNCV_2034891 [Trichonephila clavipes]|nr:hypothetical protein TNCV_2034891 [Trichonephila clavipes]